MTSLGTAILLTLMTFAGGLACDSNPTPHPGRGSKGDHEDAYVAGGGETGAEVPNNPDDRDPDDDLDPATPDDDQNGYTDECPDGFAGESPSDVRDDGNETRADVGDASGSGQKEDEDCGGGDTTPVPGASSDNGQIQNHSEPRSKERPSREP